MPVKTSSVDPEAYREDSETLRVLLSSERGEPGMVAMLEPLLQQKPELCQVHGQLGKLALTAWIELAGKDNHLLRESLKVIIPAQIDELVGPDASALERLMAARVVLCRLQAEYADVDYAEQQAEPLTPAQHAQLQRFQVSAQHRLQSAIKALLVVQKLLAPAPPTYKVALQVKGRPNAALPGATTALPVVVADRKEIGVVNNTAEMSRL